MKTFTRDYPDTFYQGEAFGRCYGSRRPCIFDIETTGLSAESGKVILTALMTVLPQGGMRITQFLAESPYEENKVLEETAEFLRRENIDYFVTFNGSAFDLPFVRKRSKGRSYASAYRLYDFDLYRFFRKYTTLPRVIPSLRQKAIEEYFGIHSDRRDVITGRESVRLFQEYTVDKDPVKEKIILTHNREDVLQLNRLLRAAGKNDFLDILNEGLTLDEIAASMGMPAAGGKLTASVHFEKSKGQESVVISGSQLGDEASTALLYPDEFPGGSAEFSASAASYQIRLQLLTRGSSSYLDMAPLAENIESVTRLTVRESLDARRSGFAVRTSPLIREQSSLLSRLRASENWINDFLLLRENGRPCYDSMNLLALLLSCHYVMEAHGKED